jgi:hypothetical protein
MGQYQDMTKPGCFLSAIFLFTFLPHTYGQTLASSKSVYVVAADANSRDLSLTSADLEVERLAKDEFKRRKRYIFAKSLADADLIFVLVVDRRSADEIALAIPGVAYRGAGHSLDALRAVATWEAAGRPSQNPLTASPIYALSHPSVAKDLVKKFHKDVP